MAVFFMVPLFCRSLEMIRTKKNAQTYLLMSMFILVREEILDIEQI